MENLMEKTINYKQARALMDKIYEDRRARIDQIQREDRAVACLKQLLSDMEAMETTINLLFDVDGRSE